MINSQIAYSVLSMVMDAKCPSFAGDSPELKDASERECSEEPLNPELSAPVGVPDPTDFTAIEMTGK